MPLYPPDFQDMSESQGWNAYRDKPAIQFQPHRGLVQPSPILPWSAHPLASHLVLPAAGRMLLPVVVPPRMADPFLWRVSVPSQVLR